MTIRIHIAATKNVTIEVRGDQHDGYGTMLGVFDHGNQEAWFLTGAPADWLGLANRIIEAAADPASPSDDEPRSFEDLRQQADIVREDAQGRRRRNIDSLYLASLIERLAGQVSELAERLDSQAETDAILADSATMAAVDEAERERAGELMGRDPGPTRPPLTRETA